MTIRYDVLPPERIQQAILLLRGQKIMLSTSLAELYEVEPRALIQAVKRNAARFPPDFVFHITRQEVTNLKSQSVISSWGGKRTLPYAFTEQGVAMLSGILNSDKAINTNIAIMRAFIEVRKVLLQQTDMREQLREIKERMGEHDTQLNQIYDAMENLLDEKAAQRKWDDRQRIGFNQ